MQLFDSHCHIDLDAFDDDRTQVLQQTRDVGVSDLLVPGVKRAGWKKLIALCDSDPGLHLALGLHPVYLETHDDADIEALVERVVEARPLAVGEIGLDWQITTLDRDRQQRLLEAQLEVAQDAQLPVVLHVRKAHDAMLNTLRRYRLPGGFCHAFNGSQQQAERYLTMGFKLGFGGMLTYERSSHLHRLASALPLDGISLETDSPDMTVASHRYQRNSPAYLPDVLKALAAVRDEDVNEIAARTSANTRSVLGL